MIEAPSSWPPARRLTAAPSAPTLGTRSPPRTPANAALSCQLPELPAHLHLRQMGRGAGRRGKHTSLLPQLPQRQRDGEPARRDPRLAPRHHFPPPQKHFGSAGSPRAAGISSARAGGTHAAVPQPWPCGGAARPARWLQPPATPTLPAPVCPWRWSRQLRHPGFIPQCLPAPYFIT